MRDGLDALLRDDVDVEPMGAMIESIVVDFQETEGGVVVVQRVDAVVGVADLVVSEDDVVVPEFQQQRGTALFEDVVLDHDMPPSARRNPRVGAVGESVADDGDVRLVSGAPSMRPDSGIQIVEGLRVAFVERTSHNGDVRVGRAIERRRIGLTKMGEADARGIVELDVFDVAPFFPLRGHASEMAVLNFEIPAGGDLEIMVVQGISELDVSKRDVAGVDERCRMPVDRPALDGDVALPGVAQNVRVRQFEVEEQILSIDLDDGVIVEDDAGVLLQPDFPKMVRACRKEDRFRGTSLIRQDGIQFT